MTDTKVHPRKRQDHENKHVNKVHEEKKCSSCCCSCGDKKKSSGNAITDSLGEMVVYVRRNTFNLQNIDLPYGIWGALYINNNYGAVLAPYLPIGVTVTNTVRPDGSVRFTYTDGVHTDTIDVFTQANYLITYAEMIANQNTNYMESNFMIMDCNAAVNATSLPNSTIYGLQSTQLILNSIGGLGESDKQIIIPKSRKMINNSVPNIIEMYLRHEPIKQDTIWVHIFGGQAIPLETVITFSWTVFIHKNYNMNAGKTCHVCGK